MGVIFDLDQTIIDSSIAYEERKNRNWQAVYGLIPQMKPYYAVIELIHRLLEYGVEVAIVTSSPRPYCERILDFLKISGVITVCYHDTEQHKPDPEPLKEAISKMKNQEGKPIIAIGDEEKDIIAANKAGILSVLAYWGNYNSYLYNKERPTVFCRDEESLLRFFNAKGVELGKGDLRKRSSYTYQLFDYYPVSRIHDNLSEQIFDEVKGRNNRTDICEVFCKAFERRSKKILPNTYGIFVVPSSTEGKWNSKLTDYVVPRLINSMGLIDCSKYILRHTTHEKQAFGGDRSVNSNLATIKLQYELPEQMVGAFIIDDITTTGNIFEACRHVICAKGVPRENIYCAAIGGTI